jgi:hypothetical protein
MATDQHSHGGRRPHFHRGRRGPDRRGDRRPQQSQAAPEQARTDGIDVDQIVREIKARIAQRHGIDLSAGQIQELAARRLEAILDPRGIKPSLLEQLRKSAGAPAQIAPLEPPASYEFEDHTIFDTHNGLLRALRKLLQPILKLFFNPNPIAHALNTQAKLNKDAARREQERERTQAEWNALHYTLVERLVTELARTSIEAQSLAMKVEALSARVDFYERRVRDLENTAQPAQPPPAAHVAVPSPRPVASGEVVAQEGSGEGARRRRRRRRGRRGPGGPEAPGAPTIGAAVPLDAGDDDLADGDEAGDDGPMMDADAQPLGGEPPASWTAPADTTPALAQASPEPAALGAPQPVVEAPAPSGPSAESGSTGTPEGS